jgi:hypothetical protein
MCPSDGASRTHLCVDRVKSPLQPADLSPNGCSAFSPRSIFRALTESFGLSATTLILMHHPLLVLFTLLLVPSAFAQEYALDKRSYLLGGALSFSSTGTDTDSDEFENLGRLNESSLTLTFGYFVAPGFSLGLNLQADAAQQEEVTLSTGAIGPRGAYYFGGPTSVTVPFLGATVGLSSLTLEIDDVGSETANGLFLGVEGGVSHFLARNVAITGTAFYQRKSFSGDYESLSDNAFGFRGGVTAFIF